MTGAIHEIWCPITDVKLFEKKVITPQDFREYIDFFMDLDKKKISWQSKIYRNDLENFSFRRAHEYPMEEYKGTLND